MKTIRMKGKTIEEAKQSALAVLGAEEEKAEVRVISEGKAGVLGIGVEEAEVEVAVKGEPLEEAKQALQEILDKMQFMTMIEGNLGEEGTIELNIKGEDMGRIIGKEGTTLKALQVLVGSILGRTFGERIRVSIDAEGYKDKRAKSLQRLAQEVADEVAQTGEEKPLPPLEAGDRRTIHLFLQNNPKVTTYSTGEGRERRLIVAPRK